FYDKNSYQRISIIGNVNGNQLLEFVEKNEEFQFTQSHLESLGYRFKKLSLCRTILAIDDVKYDIRCPTHRRYFEPEITKNKVKLGLFSSNESEGSDSERTEL
ncbi:MAG: hypothetical protein GY941_08730, partial [Planctomycetes bacterium]|nr:hypothetical protein [Planctomycetota bacterium]